MLNRREVLRCGIQGITGLSGLGLASLLRLRAQASSNHARERTAMIVVFLHGGASHLETWDPKPDAPAEYRGPFHSIETATPGLRFSELLPRQAAVSDRFTIVRSLVHTGFCHGIGQQQMFTGHEVREFRPKSEFPEFLSITSHFRADRTAQMPNYVGAPPIPYLGSAWLGPSSDAFAVHGDPNQPEFHVPDLGITDTDRITRIGHRRGLRQQLDQMRRQLDAEGNMAAMDEFEQSAWSMLTSEHARRAFDLSLEPPEVRDRYGRNQWGQQCLLARRLVESGVDLVTTTLAGSLCGRVQNWDDHAVNHHVFEAMQARAPFFDQAVAALISDIFERGLNERVMVIVTGEFGRTPRISYAPDSVTGNMQPGRDHWPSATSLMFAGGGITGGQLVGATDARGEQVVERRLNVLDFLATAYQHLGVNASQLQTKDLSGRPVPVLNGGTPIQELTIR
jgi:hypothetical protein